MGSRPDLAGLVREGTLDADTTALAWLLLDGGVPLIVAGGAPRAVRSDVAAALLDSTPERPWVLLDADDSPVTLERMAALVSGGVGLGLTLAAPDLRGVLARLAERGELPEDAVRRLGLVAIVEVPDGTPRVVALHYLRPTERDAEGHVQRRPPAVLASWDGEAGTHEDFAWGVTPELADRVDRAQADLEERRRDRAAFLATAASAGGAWEETARRYLASEPPRRAAPVRERARPSPFGGGLIDPDPHGH